MARLARLCVPGWPHVLMQAGHNRQPVFGDDADRRLFLNLLQEAAVRHGVAIHAYGLFESEVRLLVTPSTAGSLSGLMQTVGRRYGVAFNRRFGRVGSLWEGRFRATVVEPERHLLTCMRYVEEANVSADSSTALEQVLWSTAAHHLGIQPDPLVSDPLQFWSLGNTPFEREAAYRHLSQQALTPSEVSQIRESTRKGWPLGSAEFLRKLEVNTDRRVMPLRRGRPRKLSGVN